ncbi:MAG TPA: dual CXXC motif small (seleno)protein [Desulfurivibrionaceae bacterium]|nr:dual CXXC motif small (seleno)protein [Desulfurivibrionaceae bacterium]
MSVTIPTTMACKECEGPLEVLRMCRRIRMRCTRCGREFQIHEVADRLDAATEAILERYTAIIYD